MKLNWVLPIRRYRGYLRFMKTIDNCLKFEADDVAGFRFRCLQIFETQGLAGVQLAFPGVSSRSLSRWQSHWLKSGKKLASLKPKSTRPQHCRQMAVPAKILSFVKAMRQQHPRLSKYKLKIFLDEFCRQENLPLYSTSWIGKVIKRFGFFFKTNNHQKRIKKLVPKLRVFVCPKDSEVGLGYLQADGIKVIWEGKPLYFFCALEIVSRQAFAKRVTSPSSLQAQIFLEEVRSQVTYPIHSLQTDNGSEFEKYFNQALIQDQITHLWSKPRSPRVNGFVERFNGIIQEEFIDYHLDLWSVDPKLFDQELNVWLKYYNQVRPHLSLNLKTPIQKLLELQTNQPAKCL